MKPKAMESKRFKQKPVLPREVRVRKKDDARNIVLVLVGLLFICIYDSKLISYMVMERVLVQIVKWLLQGKESQEANIFCKYLRFFLLSTNILNCATVHDLYLWMFDLWAKLLATCSCLLCILEKFNLVKIYAKLYDRGE